MIEVSSLSKSYGQTKALDQVTFTVPDGQVTGFLGPNGAGKSTVMRILMGLERADSGHALVDGQSFACTDHPMQLVGALLDPGAVNPQRTARDHLRILAMANRLPTQRVGEVLDVVGLTSVTTKRIGGFSLGMRQRLGIAAALLGRPRHLVLDEPVNGLDPDGVAWVRHFVRDYAAQGNTVFLSSHLINEVAVTVDRLVVIGQGHVLAQGSVAELVGTGGSITRVAANNMPALVNLLQAADIPFTQTPDGLDCPDTDPLVISRIAHLGGVLITRLVQDEESLEATYMRLTSSATTYRSSTTETKEAA